MFAAGATGLRSATVIITGNAANLPQTVALQGAGGSPQLTPSTPSLTFAPTPVGSSTVAQYITLTSTGTTAVAVSSVSIGGANPGDFDLSDYFGTCTTGQSLNPGQSNKCILRVHFIPTATGDRSATVVINNNSSSSPQTVVLSGTGE
jgi:hypothetical protein